MWIGGPSEGGKGICEDQVVRSVRFAVCTSYGVILPDVVVGPGHASNSGARPPAVDLGTLLSRVASSKEYGVARMWCQANRCLLGCPRLLAST